MAATAMRLAKLSRPRVGKVLPRQRLFASLDQLRHKPVVWIAAQPGAGKTSLLASFLDARKVTGLWYQVDAGDSDPASFFYHLGVAAKTLARAKSNGAALPLLTAEFLPDIPGFARRYFRALYERMGRKSALVLDNLQEAPEGSPLHKLLAIAFEELPEGVNAFVASRAAPSAAYASLLGRDCLALLDAADMRLTLEETGAIAGARSELDDGVIRLLHERSGGWAAGVTLLSERANRGESFDTLNPADALHEVFGHFAEQLIADGFEADLEMMLQLAYVTRITGPLARSLTGNDGAEALLEKLHRRNLFTERRRAGGEVAYQFHNLLRAFLQGKSRESWSAKRQREFAVHAADVLEAHGEAEDAVAMRREIGDWEGVARVALALAPTLLAQERRKTLLEWIGAVPEEIRDAHPWLRSWQGTALAHLAPGEARAHFERAHAGFVRDGDPLGRVLSATGVILTHSYELASLREIDRWSDELAGAIAAGIPFPTAGIELRVQAAQLFALDFRRTPPERVFAHAARIVELLGQDVGANEKVSAAGLLLGHYWHTGRRDEGRRLLAMIQPLADGGDLTPGNRALWLTQVGWFECWSGDTPAAYRALEAGLATCTAHGLSIPVVEVYTQFGLALAAIQDGDYQRAQGYRARAEAFWKTFRRMDVAASAMLQCVLASHRGDRDAARQFAREHLAVAQEVGVTWQIYNAMLHNAFVAAEGGRHEECAEFLGRAREWAAGTSHAPFLYQADLVDAYSSLLRGDDASARALLMRGLSTGAFDRVNFFLRIQPRLLPRVFAASLAWNIESDSVRRAIRELRIAPPAHDTPGWPWPLAIRTLGRFEVRRDDLPLEFSRKAPRKTLQLLKAIIANGGTNVPEQALLDALWSDEQGDAASKSLGAAVLRLRTLLGDADAVIQQAGTLSLDRSRVWVDAWGFELSSDVDLYGGAFLAEEDGVPWPVPMRERLRTRFIQRVAEQGGKLETSNRHEEAIELYLRGLDADSIVEPFYQGLMRCYHHLDRRAEAVSTYRRLKQILSVTLGLPPSATTERLYKSLKLMEKA